MSINSIPESHIAVFLEALVEFTIHRWGIKRQNNSARYDLAILHNPTERFSPSDDAAIQKFIKAGKNNGLSVEVIEKKDFAHLPEFDGPRSRDEPVVRERIPRDLQTFHFLQ